MPSGTPGTHQEWVTIPMKWRAWITANMGYNGPWYLRKSEARQYIEAYQEANNGPTNPNNNNGGGGGDTIIINGGGSGGSYSSGPTAAQKQAMRDNYLKMLHDFGMTVTKNLNNLMDKGVNNTWSTTSFLIHLRQTKDYKQFFPGIRSQSGINEMQYNSMYESYHDEARAAGINLTRDQFGLLYKKDVRPEDWGMRVEFYKRAKNNPEFFEQLEEVARARGWLKPKEELTKKELWKAMIRKGNPRIEGLLEEVNATWQIQSVGLTIGPEGDISRKMVLDFVKKFETQGIDVETFTQGEFANLANSITSTMPMAEIVQAGLTKADLFTLEFGNDLKERDKIARQVNAILESYQSMEQKRVRNVLTDDGAGGSRLAGGITAPSGL